MPYDGFFAASNSGDGFKNYYDEVFVGAEHIFIVKGGPGTGKSRFMREVADYACARGWSVDYYYCSSDPRSLDGVILNKDSHSIAVIDGTPPHVREVSLPGVRDEIVDLGAFWEREKLVLRRDDIARLNAGKDECWRRAYKWLSGCLDMCCVIRALSLPWTDMQGIKDTADAMLAGVPDGEGWRLRPALISSVGMRGVACSSEYFRRAGKLFVLRDNYMTAHLLIGALGEAAKRGGHPVMISNDPIDADRPDGILLEDCGIAAVVSEKIPQRDFTTINMSAFSILPESVRKEADHAARCREAMLAGACDALSEIREYHFALEEIYSEAMDFKAKEAFTENFCAMNFSK